MLPGEFLTRLKNQHYIDIMSLLSAMQEPSPVSVRINRAKWPAEVIGYEPVQWEPDGYYTDFRPMYTLDPLFHAGVYYPQEASSMFAGEVLRQVAGDMADIRILDLCGAPGGKSTHISSLTGKEGLVVANEVIRQRAAVLAENITKWGLGNTVVTQNDPSAFISLPEFFDIVLVDAPCSGEGMFRDLVAREEWSPANAQLCSERQRRIVMDIWPALKPGGVLIYSTCTFNPAENEENILWLTQNTDSESVRIDISSFNGITEIGYNGITGYGFHPGRVRGDGFFLSVVRKPGAPVNYRMRSGKTKNRLSAKLLDDMSEMISIDRSRLFQRENKIIGLATDPEMFIYLGERLNVIKAGTLAGEIKNRDFVPGHDLAMSVHLRKEAFQVYDVSYDEAVTFLRFDAMSLKNAPSGRILLSYRDVPLGFANNLGRRINNGYPQAWRIRMQKRNDFRDIL